MARMARIVVPGYPHHVTQRGNRRQNTFFHRADYCRYVDEIAAAKDEAEIEIIAWCLMPNHVRFVVVPRRHDSLAAMFARAHRQYTRYINYREGWQGHLWQARFHSCVLDEFHFLAAVRYVELNPVAARLCHRPEDWLWSSARAHISGDTDVLATPSPMFENITNWQEYLQSSTPVATLEQLRMHSRTGRPLGDRAFIANLGHRISLPPLPGRPKRASKM